MQESVQAFHDLLACGPYTIAASTVKKEKGA
jgi:hypothetical protein